MLEATMEWLARTTAPNGLLLLALLTSPWTWASAVRSRIGPLLDKVLPDGDK